ncbi:MAG: hypothetical protein ACR2PA_25900 [Hyphomicrobiaceae bacterium]
MITRVMAFSVAALVAGYFAESARAAQFFVCADGRAIAVEHHELEHAKRTNPCVARYFGVQPAASPEPFRESQTTHMPVAASPLPAEVEIPVRKPQALLLRRSQAAEPARSTVRPSNKMAEMQTSTFRRVRIINARPGTTGWFHHTR